MLRLRIWCRRTRLGPRSHQRGVLGLFRICRIVFVGRCSRGLGRLRRSLGIFRALYRRLGFCLWIVRRQDGWRETGGIRKGKGEAGNGRRAWMCDNRELAVCLLDIKLRGISFDAERIVISIPLISKPSSIIEFHTVPLTLYPRPCCRC